MKTPFWPPKIPSYIRDLNDLAERHGITTSIILGPYDNNLELRLWAKWRGTCDGLQSVDLLSHHQLARLIWPRRRRGAVRRPMITVPSSEPPWCNPLLRGEMEISGDHFEWNLDFGSAHFSVADRGDVEAVTYANEVCLYGSAEALIRAGVNEARLPLGVRAAKSSRFDDPKWHSRRAPNGLHLYRFETQTNSGKRHSRNHRVSADLVRSHLRLVVDNTLCAAPITLPPNPSRRPP
jgi:hypothetical protein